MNTRFILTALTRIADLLERTIEVVPLDRASWSRGDYVAAEVLNNAPWPLELNTGRLAEVFRGDVLIGALGRRRATLEAVGGWEDVREDGRMHVLTGAGLLGRLTSQSLVLPELVRLQYRGHVHGDAGRLSMNDFVGSAQTEPFITPVVLIVGTSMSAGKTTTARMAIRLLKARGLRVIGAKLTGAGRYRDILTMRDAGADEVFDFVDVGLPSTACDADDFQYRLRILLTKIGRARGDVVVAEAGASPLEPYNGDIAFEELGGNVRCLILASADPYAVVGVQEAFGVTPDVVTGLATSTSAGCALIERLTGLTCVNVIDQDSRRLLGEILEQKLGI